MSDHIPLMISDHDYIDAVDLHSGGEADAIAGSGVAVVAAIEHLHSALTEHGAADPAVAGLSGDSHIAHPRPEQPSTEPELINGELIYGTVSDQVPVVEHPAAALLEPPTPYTHPTDWATPSAMGQDHFLMSDPVRIGEHLSLITTWEAPLPQVYSNAWEASTQLHVTESQSVHITHLESSKLIREGEEGGSDDGEPYIDDNVY